MNSKLPVKIQLRLLKEEIFHRVLTAQHLANLKNKDYIQGYTKGQLYIMSDLLRGAGLQEEFKKWSEQFENQDS
ncbi:hypothetical protein [uncultured Phascolarctobacterium sp.]|uniref:hypothetical protein n=1 Tax=uncultured Phascolarctobacterium sp. TaxID=512296 RepID=UPI0025FE2BFF|nr:hypothetical protein [uncultured Phascolarctobacterium sp.]